MVAGHGQKGAGPWAEGFRAVRRETVQSEARGAAVKKVVAFVGSARKKHTYEAVQEFFGELEELGGVECETVMLAEQDLLICRGCKLCLDRGEELCPLGDDRDPLIEKMAEADGVVFATPNYSFQVSGLTKVFLDRLGFVFHRPRFFGKTFTGIVVQGIYGGSKIAKYLDFIGDGMGFKVVKTRVLQSLEPMTEKQRRKNSELLEKQAARFHASLQDSTPPVPSLFKVAIFRMSRTSMRMMLDESYRDYGYYRDRGWFESDYFYPTRLGPLKKLTGSLSDTLSARMSKGEGE
jgi:multimeric flavodoxin WrbA